MKRKLNKVSSFKKTRNAEKVLMDRYYHPKIFRSKRNALRVQDAQQQITDYKRNII